MASQPPNFNMRLNTAALDEKQAPVEHQENIESPISEIGSDPEINYSVFRQPKLWWKHNYLSWRFYTTIYAALALLVTFIVGIATVAAIAVHGVDAGGRITLYTGACSGSFKLSNIFAHLFISGLGTYMLSASAYVMYCLSPPSRAEIDREHAQGRWLDIGIMSYRNLRRICRKRRTYFWLLGLTSPLLQFFFNAILFQTYSTNAYTALIAQETFMEDKNITLKLTQDPAWNEDLLNVTNFGQIVSHLHYQAMHGKLEKLDNKQCIEQYAVPLISDRRNVIVITESDPNRKSDIFDAYDAEIPTATNREGPEQYSWLCKTLNLDVGEQCLFHVEHLRQQPDSWTVSDNAKVKYCLSEKVPEHCKLQFSLAICLIIFVVCLFKSAVMFAVAFTVNENPLMTTGDAISSFLARPDPYTRNMCLASKDFIQNHPGGWRTDVPAYFSPKPKRWIHSIRTRMFASVLLMTLATCGAASLYCTVYETISVRQLFQLGMGAINRRYFIGWHRKEQTGLFRSFFFANSGHAVFGILYILYNNVFYAMLFQEEWSRLSLRRKGLRVSAAPRGKQRTVYFFMMPYKLAIPIMVFSCVIHSCISQTLFLVDVEAWGNLMVPGARKVDFIRQPQYDFNTTGFSPLANASWIAASILFISFVLIMGTVKFKSGMPVVSTCSAAISAACHPSYHEEAGAQLMELQWGVTDEIDGIGHCTFSARKVTMPDDKTPFM